MTTRKRISENLSASDEYEDEFDDVPLHRKQAFGAGLKRKRVQFVRAQESDMTSAVVAENKAAATAVGDLYASIVLGAKKASSSDKGGTTPTGTGAAADEKPTAEGHKVCDVCSLPIVSSLAAHNASLAHQVSIQHSHPPSHLDRSRMGLRTLNSQGWDPDARIGLGREGDGMRFPIKVAAKEDTLGIGAVLPTAASKRAEEKAAKKEEKKSLSAREMKVLRKREKEKAERLQQEIYGRVDVERYLRGG